MKVKIKKLHPGARIPQYAKPGDAAVDLAATSKEFNDEGQIVYGTGLAFEIPPDHVGLIFPRSSICKQLLSLSNSVGVIDSSFRGEVKFVFNFHPERFAYPEKATYNVGDRIGQLLVLPYPAIEYVESDELSETERGSGAFGHTGR